MHSYRSSSGSRDAERGRRGGGRTDRERQEEGEEEERLKSQGRGIDVDLVRQVGKEEAFSLSFFLLLSKSWSGGKKTGGQRGCGCCSGELPHRRLKGGGGAEHDMSERWGPANQ